MLHQIKRISLLFLFAGILDGCSGSKGLTEAEQAALSKAEKIFSEATADLENADYQSAQSKYKQFFDISSEL